MATVHISDLPYEILDIIVDELADDIYDDELTTGHQTFKRPVEEIATTSTFKNYSLISRQFTDCVQKHLFHAITVREAPSVMGLYKTLQAKHLFPHLTKLVLENIGDPIPNELITGCVNLETLVVDEVKLETDKPTPNVCLPRIKHLANGKCDRPLSNLVDLSRLRAYENRYRVPEDNRFDDAPDFADDCFKEARGIIETCSETLEAFYISTLLTSCVGANQQTFNLGAMQELTSLSMDFDVSYGDDTPVEYLLDTIRTLKPSPVKQRVIRIKVPLQGRKKNLLAEVVEDPKWTDVIQELTRLSKIAYTTIAVQVDIPHDHEEYAHCGHAAGLWFWRTINTTFQNICFDIDIDPLPYTDYNL